METSLSGGGRGKLEDTLPHFDPGPSTFPFLALLPCPLLTPESVRQPEPFVGGSLNGEMMPSVLVSLTLNRCAVPCGKMQQGEVVFSLVSDCYTISVND